MACSFVSTVRGFAAPVDHSLENQPNFSEGNVNNPVIGCSWYLLSYRLAVLGSEIATFTPKLPHLFEGR